MAVLCAVLFGACFQPRVSADYFPPKQSTSTGPDATTMVGNATTSTSVDTSQAPPGTTDGETTGTAPASVERMRLTVRTSEQGGPFRPRNVGAIWIEDADGGFVKTLAKWGTIRDRWLERWREASDENVVDAITSATLSIHETHEVAWNLTDVMGHGVEPGEYFAIVEVTDRSGPGASLEIRFSTLEGPMMLTPEETEHFHDLELIME